MDLMNDEELMSVLSTPELEFYQSSESQNSKSLSKKRSSRKRQDSEKKYSNMNLKKRKCKETTKDRLLLWNDFYSTSEFGIWIECTKCKKFRKSLEFEEEHQVPEDWCCSMNMTGIKNCDDPEDTEGVEFSEANFIPGSIVWAKLDGFPWWPGMVEDDPDTEEYYWLQKNGEMYYNITFLDDDVTHAWVKSSFVKPYSSPLPRKCKLKMKYRNALLVEDAKEKANAAIKMSIKERLQTFSFVHLFRGRWSQAISFDHDEEKENKMKMLIKQIEVIDSLLSSDSENETKSSIPENIDEGLENILNEESFASNKNPKEKLNVVDSENKRSATKKILNTSDEKSLKNDKNKQNISHFSKKKEESISVKSDTENKLQKASQPKIKESNKEINKMKNISGLEKSKKKKKLEGTDSVVPQEENKAVPKKLSKMIKKSSFTPPVRNKTEYHKNAANSKTSSNDISMNDRESVIANKNVSTNVNDSLRKTLSELVNEFISDCDESKSEKSSESDKGNDEEMEKQAASYENQKESMLNKFVTETEITEVSPEKLDAELKHISDEELRDTDLSEVKSSTKEVLENVTQNKTEEKVSSKNIIAIKETIKEAKYPNDKLARNENEILKVLEKNIKNSIANASALNSHNDENNFGFKTISETENLDAEKHLNEDDKKNSKKTNKNKTSDMKDQKSENTTVKKKLKNQFKTSQQKKCKIIRGVMTTIQRYCPVKLNKQENKCMEVPNTKISHKPPIKEIEIGDNISEKSFMQNKDAIKKYEEVSGKSNSFSDSKSTKGSEQSIKTSTLNCESETSSYSLCLNLDKEPLEDEDSDPFEAV